MRDGGYLIITDPGSETAPAGTREFSTITCAHCNKITVIRAGSQTEDADWCRLCMKPICLHCAGKGCTPFEKKLERIE